MYHDRILREGSEPGTRVGTWWKACELPELYTQLHHAAAAWWIQWVDSFLPPCSCRNTDLHIVASHIFVSDHPLGYGAGGEGQVSVAWYSTFLTVDQYGAQRALQ